jgi:hypothetical protein
MEQERIADKHTAALVVRREASALSIWRSWAAAWDSDVVEPPLVANEDCIRCYSIISGPKD